MDKVETPARLLTWEGLATDEVGAGGGRERESKQSKTPAPGTGWKKQRAKTQCMIHPVRVNLDSATCFLNLNGKTEVWQGRKGGK